jgi:diadenosine tetraphosphate (Ap4A) HIT family hydrolase
MKTSSDKNLNSHLTAKERKIPSLPLRILSERKLLSGDILDFGCGLGKDIEFLVKNYYNAVGYDPFYNPEYPIKRFDTIICFYVLNILLPEEQTQVLMSVSELLNPIGKAFFAVRRDIKRNGFLYNPKKSAKTYQCNVVLPYHSIFVNENMEIYEYQHFNSYERKDSSCPFCNPTQSTELISETATAYAIFDNFPVNEGHCLIIPKRHIADYFDLTLHEQRACWILVNRCKEIIQKKYNPDGFNIGININEAAGQTVSHVHIHLIPRYSGDVKNHRGGVRSVIPSKQDH